MPALELHSGLLQMCLDKYVGKDKRKSFVDISSNRQLYSILPMLQSRFKDGMGQGFRMGAPVEYSDGKSFKINVQVARGNTWQTMDINDSINPTIQDFQTQMTVPWRLSAAHRTYNEAEITACSNESQIVDIIVSRRVGMDADVAEGLEVAGWAAPTSSSDVRSYWGIPTWLYTQRESDEDADGTVNTGYSGEFASSNETGDFLNENRPGWTSGPGGISRATYRYAGNYNHQYTAFTTDDGIEKLRRACLMTGFDAPYDFPDVKRGMPQRCMYTTLRNKTKWGAEARKQNDANGDDIGARDMQADIYRIPMFYLPIIESLRYGNDTVTRHPIYGIDWSAAWFAALNGFLLKEKIFDPNLSHPLSYVHVLFLFGNICVVEARRCFVLSE